MQHLNQATNGTVMPKVMSQIPTDSLESIRNRLNQVHLSLRKLSDQINGHNRLQNKGKLPNYSQLQNQFLILITQLHTISSLLENNDETLKNTNVYPIPTFPTTQQEGLLTTLLRKKPLPLVDSWLDSAVERGDLAGVPIQKDDEFAQWCSAKVQELRDEFQFYGFQTIEELEELENNPESVDHKKEEQKVKEELELKATGGHKSLHPNEVLKFMCQGVLTGNQIQV